MKGQKCPCQCHDVILSGNNPVTPSCSVHNAKTPSSKTYLMSSNSKPVLRSCHLHPIIPLGRHSQAPYARDFWGAHSSLSLSRGMGTASPSTVQCLKSVSWCKLWRESKEITGIHQSSMTSQCLLSNHERFLFCPGNETTCAHAYKILCISGVKLLC